jgi:hypothetical protein
MTIACRLLLGGSLACFMPVAWAGLIGTQVTGVFTNQAQEAPNYFDPANVGIYEIPAAALNSAGLTVTIAPNAVEFGTELACNSIPCLPGNLFWANFTDTQLDIHNTAALSYSDNLYFQFTDPRFQASHCRQATGPPPALLIQFPETLSTSI